MLIVCCIAMAATGASVISLLSMSYLFIEAAILVPFMGGRFWPRGNRHGAVAASVVGILFAVLEITGVFVLPYSAITIFIPAGIAFVAVSLATEHKTGIAASAK